MTNESHPRRRVEPEPADRTIVDWKEMAAWWDERQGEEGDLWHRTLIDPTLFKVLGPVKGRHVLDLACGNGYIARKLARSGARVTGVDASTPIVEHARSREEREPLRIVYHVADAARLDGSETLGSMWWYATWPSWTSQTPKGPRGRRPVWCVPVAVLWPASPTPASTSASPRPGWVVERVGFETTVFRKVSHYRRVFEHWIPWRGEADQEWWTQTYHRRYLGTSGHCVGLGSS